MTFNCFLIIVQNNFKCKQKRCHPNGPCMFYWYRQDCPKSPRINALILNVFRDGTTAAHWFRTRALMANTLSRNRRSNYLSRWGVHWKHTYKYYTQRKRIREMMQWVSIFQTKNKRNLSKYFRILDGFEANKM